MERSRVKRLATLLIALLVAFQALSVSAFAAEENDTVYYYDSVVNTGKDTGYSESNAIDSKDPHYGWKLGEFYLSGFTRSTTDKNGELVFLKTVGDSVTLGFILEQDIDLLNGSDNLSISEDKNGYDQNFQTEKTNFGRGTLIVQHTDYHNLSKEPEIYTDYLTGVQKGAETTIKLCEEGDYEVVLDYEIKNNPRRIFGLSIVPTYTNYRISFKFLIRNGNCMVYPFDVTTGTELTNSSMTENGFYLDLANSRYLNIDIKKEVLTEGADGLTQDTRFNRPAKDHDPFTDEGIYTITVSNQYTGQQTVKTIYVGDNPILEAYVITGRSIAEIQQLVAEGATINADGTINTPTNEIIEAEPDESTDEEPSQDEEPNVTKPDDNMQNLPTKENQSSASNMQLPIVILVASAVILVAVFIAVKKKKKATTESKEE